LSVNDSSNSDDQSTWAKATDPAHGTVVVNADGTFTYTPDENYDGADSFTYTITDTDGDVSTATVSLTGTAVNDAPVASDDTISIIEDMSNTTDVYTLKTTDFGTFSDDDGDSLTAVTINSLPTNGILYLSGTAVAAGDEIAVEDIENGYLTFDPTDNSDADSNFTFSVSDGTDWSESYTTTINISALADTPTASIEVGNSTIVYKSTYIAEQSQTVIVGEKLGDASGDSNISGTEDYDYAETVVSTIDFGSDLAGQTVTLEVNVTISGSWNHGSTYFDDNWGVFVNDSELPVAVFKYNSDYASSGTISTTTRDDGVIEYQYGKDGTYNSNVSLTHTVSVDVTLDSEGKGTITFGAETTEQAETVTINSYEATFAGATVDLPYYEYEVDISASLSDTDGSETLSVLIYNVPTDGVLSSSTYEVENLGQGTWKVIVPDGISVITDTTLTLTVPTDSSDFNLEIVATAIESNDNVDGFNFAEASDSFDTAAASAPVLSMTIGDIVTQTTTQTFTSDFETEADYNTWTNDNGSYATSSSLPSNAMLIDGDGDSATKIFYFGEENAGKSVTISFTTQVNANWDASDSITVYANDTEVYTEKGKNTLDTNRDSLANGSVTHTFNAVVGNDGTVKVEIVNNSNKNNEDVWIDDVTVTLEAGNYYSCTIDLNASLSDVSETLSDITLSGVPDGVVVQYSTGVAISQNTDGSYTVAYDENGNASVTLTSSNNSFDTSGIIASVSSTESDGDVAMTIIGSSGDNTITGDSGNDYLDGGAGTDVINAEAGDDTIVYDSADTIDGGDGYDTLFVSSGSSLDLSKVSNIEEIELSNEDTQIVNLSVSDVFEMTDSDHELAITGDGSVTLDSDWVKDDASSTTTQSVYKAVYNHDSTEYTVTLHVENDLLNQ
jgi:VCBS repeat-containing protein